MGEHQTQQNPSVYREEFPVKIIGDGFQQKSASQERHMGLKTCLLLQRKKNKGQHKQ